MRKQFIPPTPERTLPQGEGWLDLECAAAVEVTSEEGNFPVESALVSGGTRGWRAAIPGTQTIRLVFDQPQKLRRISLVLEEYETTHPGVRLAMVFGRGQLVSRNCPSAVEF